MSRLLTAVAASGVVVVLFVAPIGLQRAHAQTPAQMEYERQAREARQAEERRQQEQQRLQQLQNENARRQQEELSRINRPTTPTGTPSPQYPSTPASPPSAAPGAGDRPAAQSTTTSERRYTLPGHGYFVVDVPRDWKEQVRQPPDRSPPTIVLGPTSGNSFQVLLTPTWPETKGRAPHSRDEVRAAVERGAQSAKSWAVESDLRLRGIGGSSGPGFYFSATDRAPKPGTHKVVTTGIIRVGELAVAFTISTHEAQSPIVSQALDLLKTAAIDSTGGTAAAPRTTTVAGTSAHLSPATTTIQLSRYYLCEGERVAVLRCGSDSDDAYCSVQYPDRKSAATKGMTPELAERRGDVVKKLRQCEAPKS